MKLKIVFILLLMTVAYLSLTPKYTIDVGNDKLGHLIAYTVLSLNAGAIYFESRKLFWLMQLFLMIFGIVMELVQYFVPGRTLSLFDMSANALGISIGIIITALFYRQIRHILKTLHLIR